jgi:hypothetical protein
LTVRLSQQDHTPAIAPLRGAWLGLLAGIAGAFVWLIVAMSIEPLVGPLQQRMIDEMLRESQDMPPNVREMLESVGSGASSGLQMAAGFAFHLCAAAFAALGGLLAAMFFRRDVPPALGGDPIIPPPPPVPPQ